MATEPEVVDESDEHRLVYRADGAKAELVYRRDGERLIVLHTEVPGELGGRGIGGRLVQAAVDQARVDGATIAPWCPFARKWLQRHPEVADGVPIDWEEPPPGSPA